MAGPNKNDLDISKMKGPVIRCRMCQNAGKPLPERIYCKFCLTSGYVHVCLPCNGSGRIGAPDVWGGGSIHQSTCNTCGGIGLIPAREPADPIVEEVVEAAPTGEVKEVQNAITGLNEKIPAETKTPPPAEVKKEEVAAVTA